MEAQFWISVSAAGAVLTPDRGAAAPSTGEAAAMAPRAATPVACCVCDKPLSGGRFDVDDGLVHADGARLGRGNAPSGAFPPNESDSLRDSLSFAVITRALHPHRVES